jgi:uncharacterized protein
MSQSLVQLQGRPKVASGLGFFRYREVGGDILLTNQLGDWVFVTKDEFSSLYQGKLDPGSSLHTRLSERHFLKDDSAVERMVSRSKARKRFLEYGPNLHIMVVTLRCNEMCVYCHASRADMDQVDTDMTTETAEKTVDLILQSTSPSVTIEFQGGEPLVNFPLVKHIVNYALEKNRAYGKNLEFTMVSNLSMMTEEKLEFLLEHKVQICTSIDGPETLHNKQRKLTIVNDDKKKEKGNAFQAAAYWIERINKAYVDIGLDPVLYHVEALLTTTKAALAYPKEIVDTYVGLGCRAIFLRPVDPFGFASQTAGTVEYPRNSYLDFYRQAVDHILELNKQGVQVLERFASIFLTKILTGEDPNFLDIRSPCGAGIGQVAYNYDGSIFTCDEGRMVHQMGDSFFKIGNVNDSSYRELMKHDTVRSLMIASNLDLQPDCVNCTYNPYCGVCPVHNYESQGSIWGRMRESSLCAVHKGIQDYLFEKLREDDPKVVEAFQRWTTIRERTHFIQACAAS